MGSNQISLTTPQNLLGLLVQIPNQPAQRFFRVNAEVLINLPDTAFVHLGIVRTTTSTDGQCFTAVTLRHIKRRAPAPLFPKRMREWIKIGIRINKELPRATVSMAHSDFPIRKNNDLLPASATVTVIDCSIHERFYFAHHSRFVDPSFSGDLETLNHRLCYLAGVVRIGDLVLMTVEQGIKPNFSLIRLILLDSIILK